MGMPAIQVREVTAADKGTLLILLEEYYAAAQVVLRKESDHTKYWVAHCNEDVAGCISLRPYPDLQAAAEIKRLYVRPDYRGHGIAQKLLAELEKSAAELGYEWLYLDTTDEMHLAQRLYQRSGYQLCERYNENPQATIFMRKQLPSALQLREFKPGDEAAFRHLNEAWINKYFELEEKDLQTLHQPETYILAQGGHIFMAEHAGKAVGCCALIRIADGAFELSKMGVAEEERGRGIGRRLLEYVVAEARRRGMKRLYLETNKKLENAIHLYESIGFSHVPPECVTPSPYQRADVFMEMQLA
jgi:N-acetylglutamate synthase-like GNAT family acetyltransferase